MKLRFFARSAVVASAAVLAAGCSSGSGLTTGSLFGGSSQQAAAAAPVDNNTPTGRALHVGTVSARAVKCGYNFDSAAVKSNYLAAEASSGMAIGDLTKIEQIYDTGYRGVMSAAAADPNYCNKGRTASIKTDLTKILAADYSPPAPVKVANDGGVFGSLFDQDVAPETGPKFGSGDWWDAQRDRPR